MQFPLPFSEGEEIESWYLISLTNHQVSGFLGSLHLWGPEYIIRIRPPPLSPRLFWLVTCMRSPRASPPVLPRFPCIPAYTAPIDIMHPIQIPDTRHQRPEDSSPVNMLRKKTLLLAKSGSKIRQQNVGQVFPCFYAPSPCDTTTDMPCGFNNDKNPASVVAVATAAGSSVCVGEGTNRMDCVRL